MKAYTLLHWLFEVTSFLKWLHVHDYIFGAARPQFGYALINSNPKASKFRVWKLVLLKVTHHVITSVVIVEGHNPSGAANIAKGKSFQSGDIGRRINQLRNLPKPSVTIVKDASSFDYFTGKTQRHGLHANFT
jgi:hypothetical protein